jgi:hypothetical protein
MLYSSLWLSVQSGQDLIYIQVFVSEELAFFHQTLQKRAVELGSMIGP